jgi:hypothetical protein
MASAISKNSSTLRTMLSGAMQRSASDQSHWRPRCGAALSRWRPCQSLIMLAWSIAFATRLSGASPDYLSRHKAPRVPGGFQNPAPHAPPAAKRQTARKRTSPPKRTAIMSWARASPSRSAGSKLPPRYPPAAPRSRGRASHRNRSKKIGTAFATIGALRCHSVGAKRAAWQGSASMGSLKSSGCYHRPIKTA